ncbi:MAG: M20/M25/M40 family metallo-hydrolase [Pirellulaceae bacterium]|nr:M20/M25/M40 family metallo-hydrolase [Pirellulaceae bacterium]
MLRLLNPQNSTDTSFPIILVLVIWSLITWLSIDRYQPPPVIPATADISVFSAARAEAIFQRLYEDATPHPAGKNASFRQKVIDEFQKLGYQVELHQSQAKPRNRRSTLETVPLTNLLVRLVGKTDAPPVILSAHFDSVPGAAGAADDGAGLTALIEIARMLRDEPPLERDVVFLITDGEELGMLGAQKFVEEHPLASEAAVVINLEARGTTGPSILFETSSDSQWLIEAFANSARRPYASSLFYEIYKLLPNDTDFTIFKGHGLKGCNFAFIGDVKNYHTVNDNFKNLDRRSLQHHGENTLNLLRAIMKQDIEAQKATTAVYFDLIGFRIFRWPESMSIWMSLLGCLCLISFYRWSGQHEGSVEVVNHLGNRFVSLGAIFVGVIAVTLAGLLLDYGLRWDGVFENGMPDQPFPIQASFWLLGISILLALGRWAGTRLQWQASWLGVWLVWSCLAILTSLTVTGASYLFIVPVLIISLATVVSRLNESSGYFQRATFVSCVGAMAAGLIWLPIERLFYDAVGFRMNLLLAVRVAITTSVLIPVIAVTSNRQRTRLGLLTFLGWIVLILWGVWAN